MKIKIILPLALVCACFQSFRQETVDTKAKAILDELSVKTKSYTTIKSEFTLTIENKQKKTSESQNGTVFMKGDKYKITLKTEEIFCDGKTVWNYNKDANEVQINTFDPNDKEALNPKNIFTIYEKDFKYKFEKEDATTQYISLFPLKPDKKRFHTVKMQVDKTKKQISSVKFLYKDGAIHTLTIKTFIPNGEMEDSMFTFDKSKHPKVIITDLRDDD